MEPRRRRGSGRELTEAEAKSAWEGGDGQRSNGEGRRQGVGREWIDGSSVTGGAGRGNELEGLGSAKHLSLDRRQGTPQTETGGEEGEGELSRRSGTKRNRDRD
jgi:hypothetical protein